MSLKKNTWNICFFLVLMPVFTFRMNAQEMSSAHRFIEQSIKSIGDIRITDSKLLSNAYNQEDFQINFGHSSIEINDSTNDLSVHLYDAGLKQLNCMPKVYRSEVTINFNLADVFYFDREGETISQQGMQIGVFWITLRKKGEIRETGMIKGKRVEGCLVAMPDKIPFYYRKDIPGLESQIWRAIDSSGTAARIQAARSFFENKTKVRPDYNEVNDYLTYMFRHDIAASVPPFAGTAPNYYIDFKRSYVMLVSSFNKLRYYVTSTNGVSMNDLSCASVPVKCQWQQWDFSLVDIKDFQEDSTWSYREKNMEIGKLLINLNYETAVLSETAEVNGQEIVCPVGHFKQIPLYYRKDIPGQKEQIISAILYLKSLGSF